MKAIMLVKFNHADKTATMKIVNEEMEVASDFRGQALENMRFPYNRLEYYPELFEPITLPCGGDEQWFIFPKDV